MDERWKLVQQSKLCYNCLKPSNYKHFSKICHQPKCSVANCGRHHHKLLHGQPLATTPQYPITSTLRHVPSTSPQHVTNSTLSGLASTQPTSHVNETLLQTAVTRLSVNGQEMTARVLLDSVSQRSYLRKNIAVFLGLKGPIELLSVTTLGGKPVKPRDCKECDLISYRLRENQQKLQKWNPYHTQDLQPPWSCQVKSSEQSSPTRFNSRQLLPS